MSASNHPSSILFAQVQIETLSRQLSESIYKPNTRYWNNDWIKQEYERNIKYWQRILNERIRRGLMRMNFEDSVIRPLIDNLINDGVVSKPEVRYLIQWEDIIGEIDK